MGWILGVVALFVLAVVLIYIDSKSDERFARALTDDQLEEALYWAQGFDEFSVLQREQARRQQVTA